LRKIYYNFDKEVVDALDKAREACSIGDVPDTTLGIISLLAMDGWEIKKKAKQNVDKRATI